MSKPPRSRRATSPTSAPASASPPARSRPKITDDVLARARQRNVRVDDVTRNPFLPYKPAPGVVPANQTKFAMDGDWDETLTWAAGNGLLAEGQYFVGYPELAVLAQRPEYRVISETIATEMTRKWIKFTAKGDDDNEKADRITAIEAAFRRLNIRDAFKELAEQDGFFGRSHLFLDFGGTNDTSELKTPIGDGRNNISLSKVKMGSLERVKTVEAVWCYPALYNSNNPLAPDWYKPQSWYVMGKEVHVSRLLTFIGREVPDILKPAYAFGGLSLSQMAKPYVDNWLRTRQSVSDLLHSFSVSVLKGDLSQYLLDGGDQLFKRAKLFNDFRDNKGLMVVDKESEDFENISTPLGTLDHLQAQSQEHMAAVSKIPLVKLTGISPSGLNASSDGEMRCFEDMIHAYQEALFRVNLTRVLGFVQLSEFGDVDPDIDFEFLSLYEMTDKEKAEVRKIDADTDLVMINAGVVGASEARQRVANDVNTLYPGLDVDVVPSLPAATTADVATKIVGAIVGAHEAALISDSAALAELKASSGKTGLFSTITDAMIAEADSEPPAPESETPGGTESDVPDLSANRA